MDDWKDHYIAHVGFGFKNGFQKMEESARWSTQRVLPWHGKSSKYLEGTAEKMEGGHV
jgi:hypothetical protein